MQIRTTDANGVEFSSDAPYLDDSAIATLNTFELSKKKIKDRIDNLDISSDAKFMLNSFMNKTIEVVVDAGKVIIWIGRKILDVIVFVGRHFPNATFGMVCGAVIGILIGSIPIIGSLLGGIAPILAILGLSLGAIEDLKQALAGDPRVREIFSPFDSLRTISS